MSTAMAYDASCETYRDVEGLIHQVIRNFQRVYNDFAGTFEELEAEAGLIFVRCFHDYDRSKGLSFSQYLHWKLRKHFMEIVRTKMRKRNQNTREVEHDGTDYANLPKSEFCMETFLRSLSINAQMVVTIALIEPAGVELAILERGRRTPRNIRAAIREYLTDLGWSASDITKSFTEIWRAL